MKFLCLAYEAEDTFHAMSAEEWASLRAETLAYVEELRNSGYLVSAEPLQSARRAATVRVRNDRASVIDGPYAETKEQLGGFFLIEAQDLDEAVRLASKWPSARIGSIEVRPIEAGLPVDARYR